MHVTFSQKTKVETVNRVIKTCSLDLETYFKYFVLLHFVLLHVKKKKKLFTLYFPEKVMFCRPPKFSVMAQRKLKSVPALCAIDFLGMFLRLFSVIVQ